MYISIFFSEIFNKHYEFELHIKHIYFLFLFVIKKKNKAKQLSLNVINRLRLVVRNCMYVIHNSLQSNYWHIIDCGDKNRPRSSAERPNFDFGCCSYRVSAMFKQSTPVMPENVIEEQPETK